MNKKKINDLIIVLPFFMSIFTVYILNETKPIENYSFIENRFLVQKPNFSIKNIKEFTASYEEFYSDQFIKRESLFKEYIKIQLILNKSSINDIYINGPWLLGKVDDFHVKVLDRKVNEVINLKNSIYGKNITYFSVPHKAVSLSHLYPDLDTSVTNYISNKTYFINSLNDKGITAYNLDEVIKSKFEKEKLESMYYKTDHHWNAFGAYAATIEILNKLNVSIDESLYEIIEITNKSFLGSYNRELGSIFSRIEKLSYIKPKNIEYIKTFAYENGIKKEVNPTSYLSIEKDNSDVSYLGFYHMDLPYLKITNENSTTDRKILIIRDSYEAPATLMFSSLFREVEIIDDRHISTINKTLEQLIKESEATDIIYFKYL